MAAKEEVGREIAQQQIGIGDGGLGAAATVAGRAGIGAGASGPTCSRPTVDRGNGTAAGTDLDHVDHRRFDRQAGTL